jgi:hypothetical protein
MSKKLEKIDKDLRKRITSKLRASLADIELATDLEELFDYLETIIDETSESLDEVNEAMDEAEGI